MKRKLIYLFILTIISILLIPAVSCFAQSGTCGDKLNWNLSDDGVLTISGTGEMYDYDQTTAPWYVYTADSNPITAITVNKGVTSIGSYAFYKAGMSGASQTPAADIVLTLPEGLTKISKRAFYSSAISEINLPSTISSLSSDAFYVCPMLTAITIPESNKFFTTERGVLFGNYGKILIKYPEQKQGTSYTIPSSVEQIGYAAFYNTAMLERVTFNSRLKEIDDMAFCYCTMLENIDLPSSLETIGVAAFAYAGVTSSTAYNDDGTVKEVTNYYSIDSVTIPKYVSKIGEGAFQDMKEYIVDSENSYFKSEDGVLFSKDGTKLLLYPARKEISEYIIPDTVTSISGSAFYNAQLESLTIPNSVNDIDSYTFSGSKIRNINLSEGLKEIKSYMFSGCENLKGITIPDSVTSIGEYAFRNCSSLQLINLPDAVKTIGAGAFYGCTSLEEITIPKNVTTLSESLFRNNTALKSVYLPNTLTSIGERAFYRCEKLSDISLYEDLSEIGEYAFAGCESLTEIDIPASVSRIETAVFTSCTALSRVILHNGLSYIGQTAFYKCPIKSIDFPESLSCIDEYAFHSTSLEAAILPDSVEYVGSYAFQNCTQLTNVILSRKMPEIKSGTFSGCSALNNIRAYDTLKSVGNYAFRDCKNLIIKYFGTPEAFSEISVKAVGNDAFKEATVTCINPIRKNVELINNYDAEITVLREVTDDGKLSVTITSKDGSALPPLALYAAEYDTDGTLKYSQGDRYNYLEDINYKVLTVNIPDTMNYKIMLWDQNNKPVTDVISEL